ncbi:MAG: hypothetical protein ACYCW6_25050 [Candidatus Xenobia bacterium]
MGRTVGAIQQRPVPPPVDTVTLGDHAPSTPIAALSADAELKTYFSLPTIAAT